MKRPLRSLRSATAAAFTLMEIMLVVMIIALLAGLAVFQMGDVFGIGQETAAKADMRSLKTALVTYRGTAGNYPTTGQGLAALAVRPESDPRPLSWRKVMEAVPRDPWGNDYVYVCPGAKNPDSYDLYSVGKDRQPNTQDDIWP